MMKKIIALYKEHKRHLAMGGIAVLALSIPIVIAQVLKQQDIRQRASAGDPVTLSFSPLSGNKQIGDEFDVQLLMNTNTNDISAIDGYLKYYDSLLELQSVTASSPYVKIDRAAESYGTAPSVKVQRITLYNLTQSAVTGPSKTLVTLRFKALANGAAPIGFDSDPREDSTKILKIAASGFAGNVPITNTGGPRVGAAFTIGTTTETPTCAAGSSPVVVLPTSHSYVFTYSGPTIPVTDFATVLNPKTSNVQRFNFPSGPWKSWFRPSTGLATLTSISNGDLLSVGGTSTDITSFEAGLCMKNSYDPDPIQIGLDTDHTTIITALPPPAGTTTYDYVDTNNIHWIFWVNKGKQYQIRQDSITPTATPTPTATGTPTSTPTATATPATGETRIIMAAVLDGIGKAAGENTDPHTPSRTITAIIKNFTTKAAVGDPIQGSLVYEPASGLYKGTITLPSTFQTGQYDIKIKMNNTLYKMQRGITVTAGIATNTMPATLALVPSDLDQDNRISISDYTIAVACLQSPVLPACTPSYVPLADINDNRTNDSLDFVILQKGFSTPIEGD